MVIVAVFILVVLGSNVTVKVSLEFAGIVKGELLIVKSIKLEVILPLIK